MLGGYRSSWLRMAFTALGALLPAVSVLAGPPLAGETLPAEATALLQAAIRDSECGPISDLPGHRQFPRLRFFGTPCGCASQIFASSQDEDIPVPDANDANDPIFARLDVWVGNDNPYFDLRRPGMLGGVGYYRVNADYWLLDEPRSSFVIHCRAVTPAGLAAGGIEHGPTIVRPGLTWSQVLGPTITAQAFVETKMVGGTKPVAGPEEAFRYGFAVQHALLDDFTLDSGEVYLFVQALGRNAAVGPPGTPGASRWDVVPGVRWEPDETFWLSGGVMFGSGRGRTEALLWQITCACRF
ncbi:hypothetical protein AYO44_04830 [Planctomycetaceae bacterium SCGC AG-212-F19]|nr:hypothetical protein AYO44_04830 [Planctomycetaceae bacterium SCGC AG-212-F19]